MLKFWKKKYKVAFHMKSGATIRTTCDRLEIKKNGNDLISYNIEGSPDEFLFYVRLDDISAITLEK